MSDIGAANASGKDAQPPLDRKALADLRGMAWLILLIVAAIIGAAVAPKFFEGFLLMVAGVAGAALANGLRRRVMSRDPEK